MFPAVRHVDIFVEETNIVSKVTNSGHLLYAKSSSFESDFTKGHTSCTDLIKCLVHYNGSNPYFG